MKVKIKGDGLCGHDYVIDTEETPVMLILSQGEKELIANMAPNATKFLVYPDTMSDDEAKEFIGS